MAVIRRTNGSAWPVSGLAAGGGSNTNDAAQAGELVAVCDTDRGRLEGVCACNGCERACLVVGKSRAAPGNRAVPRP